MVVNIFNAGWKTVQEAAWASKPALTSVEKRKSHAAPGSSNPEPSSKKRVVTPS